MNNNIKIKKVIQRFDFLLSFCECLLGCTGLVALLVSKDTLSNLIFIILIIINVLFIIKELIDIKRIIQDQAFKNAAVRLVLKQATPKDINILEKRGFNINNDKEDKK